VLVKILIMEKNNLQITKPIIFFVLFFIASAVVFYLPFKIVKDSTIKSLNDQQLVMARQASLGINEFFDHYTKILAHQSQLDDIIRFNGHGQELINALYQLVQDEIAAITRIDATGHILYTFPYNEKAIGKDISHQEHNRLISKNHQTIVSDVFTAVQGFRTVALAVPVFDNGEYAGAMSVLIPFEIISQKYLENVVLGEEGYAWMLSKKGVELYCPVPGHIGQTIFKTSSQFPTVIEMAGEMMKGVQGSTTYVYNKIKDEETKTILKHASYYPVHLPGNLWSIVVATPEKQALQAVSDFGKWWLIIFSILIIGLLFYVSLRVRCRITSREEKKLQLAEQKVLEKEQFFSRFMNTAHVPIAMININGTIEFLNEKFQETYGYTLSDISSMNDWFENAYPDENIRREIRESWQARLEATITDSAPLPFQERTITCKDGSTKDVIFSYTLIDDRVVVLPNDITEHNKLMRAEKELLQKQSRAKKMEAIGLMAGGVAHDLNNILSGVISYPELLLLQLPGDNPMRETILAIQKSGHRAAAVVADLLTVARGVTSVREIKNINTIIQNYLESAECRKLKSQYENISWNTEFYPDLSHVSCSPIHIEKCLMNLIINAAEAIDEEGGVYISTRNQHLGSTESERLNLGEGEYVVLSVRDTGNGIPQEDLEHIFEPFYTKKKMGRSGTGLGLAVVWNTLEDHGGTITVKSSSKGTLFDLYFPTSREALTTDAAKKEHDVLKGNGEHILVVDDEPHQRDIASKILSAFGYRVDSVSSGEEAVEYLKNNKVDLVLLDMLMGPNMNGRETYKEIVKIYPRQKAVISSGFSQNDEVKKAQKLGAEGFIKKPYSMEQLANSILKELRK
jgi:PAS domain S-box-containing protein